MNIFWKADQIFDTFCRVRAAQLNISHHQSFEFCYIVFASKQWGLDVRRVVDGYIAIAVECIYASLHVSLFSHIFVVVRFLRTPYTIFLRFDNASGWVVVAGAARHVYKYEERAKLFSAMVTVTVCLLLLMMMFVGGRLLFFFVDFAIFLRCPFAHVRHQRTLLLLLTEGARLLFGARFCALNLFCKFKTTFF